MEATINSKKYFLDECEMGAILKELYDEGYFNINLTNFIDVEHFELYLLKDTVLLSLEQIIDAFKIAHYLNSKKKMQLFGTEIASRIKCASYKDINQIINYLE